MFGWLRLAADWASRRNRATNDGSVANSGNRILTATGRSSSWSRARNTSAIPPRPMRAVQLVAAVEDDRFLVGHACSSLRCAHRRLVQQAG